ncbi:unnamed protein product, partial [marine sediment metagenome]
MVKFEAKILNNKKTNQKSINIPSYIIKYGHLQYIPERLYHIEITLDVPMKHQIEVIDEMKETYFSEDGNIKNLKKIEIPRSESLKYNFEIDGFALGEDPRSEYLKNNFESVRNKLKEEINADTRNAKFENYHGDSIVKEDYDILIEFEKELGIIPKIVPKLSDFRFFKFGYITIENRVVELYIYNKKLSNMPKSIGQLKFIQRLDLRRNNISIIPDSIGQLNYLKKLFLDENQIETLPESIGNLTNLTGLFLYKNKLVSLPETIGNLKSLIELDLSNNKIAKLPETFENLPIIHNFNFINNELSTESE